MPLWTEGETGMTEWIRILRDAGFEREQLRSGQPMCELTTMKVGGPADLAVFPRTREQVLCALEAAKQLGCPCLVVGGGTNLIVRDGGIRGIAIVLSEGFHRVTRDGCTITAEAGARLSAVGNEALKANLSGFEFACGIPGTVGGAVVMNAGAYGGQIADCLLWADLFREGKVYRAGVQELELGYRSSRVLKEGHIVLSACFSLTPGDGEAILGRMNELAARRRDNQPLNHPSSGSTFKRPQGHFAGALIQQAGLKGYCVGGAQVSEKHAGFVINRGGATARDVLELICQVQDRVQAMSGVHLECEVRVVGED